MSDRIVNQIKDGAVPEIVPINYYELHIQDGSALISGCHCIGFVRMLIGLS